MNPRLSALQSHPFEELKALVKGVTPGAAHTPISFDIGEPKHPTPALMKNALVVAPGGPANYPMTLGSGALRQCIATWLERRYSLSKAGPAAEVIPVDGSREALFSFTQAMVDGSKPGARVLYPNPSYQIYENSVLLTGATSLFANSDPARNYAPDFAVITSEEWRNVQFVFVCSPGNPTDTVLTLEDWEQLFALSSEYGLIIASDECYFEICFDGANPPLGALQAVHQLGHDLDRLMMFSSLSKRSNVPGMRSGFIADSAKLFKVHLLYRTYHGSTINPSVQSASTTAWDDETHVHDNRAQCVEKFQQVTPMLTEVLNVALPDATLYLQANVKHTGMSDTKFAYQLPAAKSVAVLPDSYSAHEAHGTNPGQDYAHIALAASVDECLEGARRIVEFCQQR